MIVHPNLNVYVLSCVDYFPVSVCEKLKHRSLFMKVLIQIVPLLHDYFLDETFRLDKIGFCQKLDNEHN